MKFYISCLFILLFSLKFQAQNDSIASKSSFSFKNILYNNESQTSGYISYGYNYPFTKGQNFLNNALNPRGGFNFNINVFVYKQLYVGYQYNMNYFGVENPSLIGEYTSSRMQQEGIVVGYDFLPFDKWRLGVEYALDPNFRMRNIIENGDDFKDYGDLSSFRTYLSYEITNRIHAFVSYSFNSVETSIEVPQELDAFFREATYNNFAFGLTFYFGKQDFLTTLSEYFK
jgi:hypothetical protein